MNTNFKKILLIRTDRIGDVVLTTPIASILHKHYPDLHIAFLTRKYTEKLLKHYKYIDEIITYDLEDKHKGLKGIFRLSKELETKQFDAAFLFYPRLVLACSIRLAKIPIRIGSGFRGYSFLLNHRIYEHRKYGQKHELDYNLSLLSGIGITFTGKIEFDFQLDSEQITWWDNKTKNLKLSDSYTIIHAGSGGSAPNLNFEQYCSLITHLHKTTSFDIVLTGSENEEKFNQKIESHFKSSRIINLSGNLSLEQLMMVIKNSKIFISSSTGPLHIANAFNVPSISFYCPSPPCSPNRWGPYHQQAWILKPDVKPCKNCIPNKCPHGNCLSKIPDLEIIELLDKRLKSLNL